MERKLDFTYTYREAVGWLYNGEQTEHRFGAWAQDVVVQRIEAMKRRGWDSQKILDKCTDFTVRYSSQNPAVCLTDLVYYDHPILSEWSDNSIRLALYKMTMEEIIRNKVRIFKIQLTPEYREIEHKPYLITVLQKEIKYLEEFTRRISEEITPSREIKNK